MTLLMFGDSVPTQYKNKGQLYREVFQPISIFHRWKVTELAAVPAVGLCGS